MSHNDDSQKEELPLVEKPAPRPRCHKGLIKMLPHLLFTSFLIILAAIVIHWTTIKAIPHAYPEVGEY